MQPTQLGTIKGILLIAATLLVVGISTPSASAAVLQFDGSILKLVGATGVDIGGVFFDVEFVEGTCIDLFSGCDAPADFNFQSEAAANQAAQALIDQVFVGPFDTDPTLTFGCSFTIVCASNIPFALGRPVPPPGFFEGVLVFNQSGGNFIDSGQVGRGRDTSLEAPENFARFTPTPVPVPSAMLLMGTGLLGLIGYRKWSAKTT